MGLGDKYVLEVPIGESETGTVWAAKETSGGRRVVIAILEEDAPDELKASFEAQAQALCSLQHPNVVRGLEAGRNEDGAPYLVMERLEGVSLAKRWASSPPLRADRTLEIGIGVVDGLAKVHEQSLASGAKLIHGDVEPGNVMLVGAPGKEVAKLIGFGLNRATTRLGSPGSRASLSTVEPFAFAAPEQARGEVDASVTADLYSAAALIFAGLTGRPPHVAESASALADAIAKQPAPAFISVRKDLAPFAATLDRALAIDPHRRYADGQALARALRTALAMGRIVGSKETPVGPRLALAVAGAAPGASSSGTLSSAGGTRASVMPPKPSESGKATQEVSGSEPAAKAPEPATKASEPATNASEPATKASEAPAKASEAPARAAEVNAQDPETDGKATPQVPAVASADGTPKLASDTNDGAPTAPSVSSDAASASDSTDAGSDAGSSSGEVELVSGELTIDAAQAPKSQRPPPPPTMDRDSGFDVVSGVVQLEPEPAKAPSVRPPPSPTTSSARPPPPKPVHGWMPAPAPANAGAPEGAAPAARGAAEPSHEEALAPALSALELGEESAAVPALTSPDEDSLARPAANGPPMWLVAALTLTVVSLGGIYAFVRLGHREPPTTTGSLGTILEGSDGQPTIAAPPVTTPPAIEPAPVAAPVEPPVTAPVEPPPVAAPPPPLAPPPIEPRLVAPAVASPERVARPETPVVRPTPPRAPTGTGTAGTPPRTSTGAGTRPPGARVTPGARATGAQSPTSMATTMTTGMSPTGGGRTTVVTDPGF